MGLRCSTVVATGISVVLCFLGSSARAQTWSAGFFNTGQGWIQGTNATGQLSSAPVGQQWQGNDPETTIATNVVGGTDVLQYAAGYTPFGSEVGNLSLIQGGAFLASDYFPGTNSVSLWRSFTPIPVGAGGTVTFFAEWSIIGSLNGSFPNLDTFAFDLRNAANSQSLLTLQFTPGINVLTNAYTLQTIANGAPTNTLADLGYQALYQLQVDLTDSTYDVTLRQINPATRTNLATFNLATGEALASGTSAADFGTVAVDWDLTSGNPSDPGSNYIIVNDVSVVPEPSTYALLCFAFLALMFFARRRFCR